MKKLLILLLLSISCYSYSQDTTSSDIKYDVIQSYSGASYNVIVKEISSRHLAFIFEGETAVNYISTQEFTQLTLASGRVVKGEPRIENPSDVRVVKDITETFGLVPVEESFKGESKGEFSTYSDSYESAISKIQKQAFDKGCHIVKINWEVGSQGVYAYNLTISVTGYKFKDDIR